MQVRASQHEHRLIKCSITDYFTLRAPVPVIFFYRKKIPQELIVESLQKTLCDFPLFAGTMLMKDDELFIDCNNHGVRLKSVTRPSRLMDDFPKAPYTDPIDPKKGPVLTVQLNYCADGMAIGFTWNHAVGDMATFMAFVLALSACAKGDSYAPPLIVEERDGQTPLKKGKACESLKRLGVADYLHLARAALSSKRATYLYFTREEVDTLRDTLSRDLGYKISRNSALSAHLMDGLHRAGADRKSLSYAVNLRPRLAFAPDLLGNFLGTATVHTAPSLQTTAARIHEAIQQYQVDDADSLAFVRAAGGTKKINRILPKLFLPQERGFMISSWTNFGVYAVDFGIEAPYLFYPSGRIPLPWVGNIVEGPNQQGLLATLILSARVTKRLELGHLHRFRTTQKIPAELISLCLS